MNREPDKIVWFVPMSDEAIESLVAGERAAAWRVGAMILPILLVIWWPMRLWLTLVVNDDSRAIGLCAVTSGLCLLAPLLLFAQVGLHRRMSRRGLGTTYRVNDRRIRWGDKRMASWRNLVAYCDDCVARRQRRPRVMLVRQGGRTHEVQLSDDPAVAAAMRAMLAARLPRYDPSTHGAIDLPAELPGWTVALLASLGIVFLAAMAWAARSTSGRESVRSVLPYAQLIAFGIVVIWYWAVRGSMNGRQRDRAIPAAAATAMGLWIAAISTAVLPMAIRTARDLRAIPPDVRARVSGTISSDHRRR